MKIREGECNQIEDGTPNKMSFKDKLMADAMDFEKEINSHMEEIEIEDSDMQTRRENGMQVIEFSHRIQCPMAQSLQKTVIVRLLGRPIGYKLLCTKIEELWEPENGFKIIDLDNDSLAGRLTLVKSALTSMPSYLMQSLLMFARILLP